jgi:hypothetical protein
MKTLRHAFQQYVHACFSGLWVETYEPDEAIREIRELCTDREWKMAVWDVNRGLDTTPGNQVETALEAITAASSLGDAVTPKIMILRNFHRYLKSSEVLQALEQGIQIGKSDRTYFVILSPVVQIPVELEKLFTIVDHPLPDRDQLAAIATGILSDTGLPLPDASEMASILDAAAGLTRYEAENTFSLSIIEHGRIAPEIIWTMKANILRNSTALRLYRGEIPNLGGLAAMTAFCTRILAKKGKERAKGVMLLGVSGAGKSAFCKLLGHLVKRPTLILDVSALMGSLVGESEASLRKALKQIDAMGECIVMIDEVEKCLANGGRDGGVSSRLLGTLLTWLNDREGHSFVVCTANDITKLPPEFTRAERFDAIYFVDLPERDARQIIWSIYECEFEVAGERPDDTDWTGAEIKACCRLAKMLDVPLKDAALNVVPVADTARESIESLRNWASGRCLDANRPGVYRVRESNRIRNRRNLLTDRNDDPPAAAAVVV